MKTEKIFGTTSESMQIIMELQKANGQLISEAANLSRNFQNLSRNVEKQNDKVDKLIESVSRLSYIMYATGVVLAIFLVVSGFLIDKSWVLVAELIKQIPAA